MASEDVIGRESVGDLSLRLVLLAVGAYSIWCHMHGCPTAPSVQGITFKRSQIASSYTHIGTVDQADNYIQR